MLTAQAAHATALVRISNDLFTNVTSQHKTEVEPDTFSFGSTIVSAFQVGRFFNGGASGIGWATSTDAGATWSHGFLPGITLFAGGTYDRVSDPSVAFDAEHGAWLISEIGIRTSGIPPAPAVVDVLVSRSTDGGLTWADPAVAAAFSSKPFLDKNWTACDDSASSPFFGNCYTEFDNVTENDRIFMTTSADGGLTWSSPVPVGAKEKGIGGQPLVQPDGRVVVPVNGFINHAFTLLSFVSTDGGVGWTKPVVVARVAYRHPAGGIRAGILLPSAEMNDAGEVFVAWPDCRFEPACSANDIVMSRSTDGVVWSPVSRVPIDPVGGGVDHFIPGLSVDAGTAGNIGLAYYFYPDANCTAVTCRLEVGFVSSTDGGASWTLSRKLAGPMSLSWLASTTQGRMVGDYISTSFSGGAAHPVFAVASAPTGSAFHEAMFTAVLDVVGQAGVLTSRDDQVLASTRSSTPRRAN